ncbi:TAXI family TRAP transporter solute-binding subunit [Oceanidesulfovibrio marinus]|nr:TAXI family TRAP transporter solute-binding subunit [Oceanidesulfovibrio marinus]
MFRRTVVALAMAALICSGLSTPFLSEAHAADAPKFMTIGGGSSGGTFQVVANLFAQVLSKESGIKVTAQSTTGAGQNIILMGRKDLEMGIVDSLTNQKAVNGEDQFKQHPNKDVRAISLVYTQAFHQLVRTGEDINKMSDLVGRTLVVGGPASGTELQTKTIYAAHGITYDDIKPQFLGINEGLDLLRNRQADGETAVVPYPFSTFTELTITNQGKLISLDEDAIAKLTTPGSPFVRLTIPAEVYSNQKEPIHTVGNPTVLAIDAGVSDDLAYTFTKAFWENIDWLKEQHHAFKNLTLEDAASAPIPLHPGAARYYKEVGVLK